MSDSFEDRARARRSWSVRTFRLGDEPSDDLSATTTPAERIGMMWQLAQDAWAVAGLEIPTYERHETPISVRRLTDEPEDPRWS